MPPYSNYPAFNKGQKSGRIAISHRHLILADYTEPKYRGDAMHVWKDKMQRVRQNNSGAARGVLTALLGCASFFVAMGVAQTGFADGRPKPTANAYSISIAGCLTGTGTATFDGTTLSITGTVTDDNGNKGSFNVTGLKVDAKNHFSGTGTAMGDTLKIGGRLDPVASKETALRTDRLVCTFKFTAKDLHGRVAGFVPVDPAVAPPKKDPTPEARVS